MYLGEKVHHVYYQTRNGVLAGNVEASIAAALLPLMITGAGRCEISGTISPRFLASLEKIQDIYYSWQPSCRLVTFTGDLRAEERVPTGSGTGAFFSAGVDSFYTLLKHQDEISDLVFVHGFDISLEQRSLYETVSNVIRYIGKELRKNVIEVETNIRSLLDLYVSWEMSHGAALASVGFLLSRELNRIYISPSYTYTMLHPWGTHPFLDYLWGTEAIEFIHDNCDTSRTEKTGFLTHYELPMRTLRVCWQNLSANYNCGHCRKCLITMIDLYVFGSLERCTTFDVPICIDDVYNIDIEGNRQFTYLRDNLLALEKRGLNPELQKALRRVLLRQRYFRDMVAILKNLVKTMLRKAGAI